MKKKLIITITALVLALGAVSCGTDKKDPVETPEVETETSAEAAEDKVGVPFAAEYEMKGMTSAGVPKSDTFIFEGITDNDIITELNFDIIRDKGTEEELSKKDIYGYQMNVSDAVVEKEGEDFKLPKFTAAGYDDAFEGGQFMVMASSDVLNDTTAFKDLIVMSLGGDTALDPEVAIAAFKYVAVEAGIDDFNGDTLVKDLLSEYELYKDGSFVEGEKRISFAGYNGGRSYGEQLDAIVDHILKEKMTLTEVYEMFKTVNPMEQPISERDTVSGATITFVGDFQRIVYLAEHGELFEGVVTHRMQEENTRVEVATQGYGGEIVTHVTFNPEGEIVAIAIRDAQETPEFGGLLTAEDSDFMKELIDKQDNVTASTSSTVSCLSINSFIKSES